MVVYRQFVPLLGQLSQRLAGQTSQNALVRGLPETNHRCTPVRCHCVINVYILHHQGAVRSIATSVFVCMYVCLSVCLYVWICPLTYLKITCPNFTKCSVHVHCGRDSVSCHDNAIRYVLLVLWMTSCLCVMVPVGQNQQTLCFVEFARWRHRGQSCWLTHHTKRIST